MGDVIHVLKRGDGRTVYQRGGTLRVRFDSIEDRERFDLANRVVDLADREDVDGAAMVLLEAVDSGLIGDADELLEAVDDEVAREVIRLEYEKRFEALLGAAGAAVRDAWRPDTEDE